MIAVEPEGSERCAAALEAGQPVPVTPDTAADALTGPFAGENCLEICRALGVETVLVSEDEIGRHSAGSTRGRSSPASSARRPSTAAILAGKVAVEQGKTVVVGRLGRQRGPQNRPLLSWPSMKTDIHPEYVLATVTCSCGNTFQTRSTKPELHVEICSNCHPFYTGKQKLMDTGGRVERFQKKLERAERAKRAAAPLAPWRNIGGQAVLEGVMMRGPGNWAVAVRTPNGEIAHVARPVESAMARHRVLRLPVIRGVMALGESLAIGFRALAISANYAAQEEGAENDGGEPDTELSRGALFFAFAVAIGFALAALQGDAGRC